MYIMRKLFVFKRYTPYTDMFARVHAQDKKIRPNSFIRQ